MRALRRVACSGLLWACLHAQIACTVDGVVFEGFEQGARDSDRPGDAGTANPKDDAGQAGAEDDGSVVVAPGDGGPLTDAGPNVVPAPMWTLKDLPYASGAGASAVLSDGLHYLGGSNHYFGATRYQKHYRYDAASGTWSDAPADVPDDQTWGARAHVYKDRLYLLGGFPNGNLFRVYTFSSDSWGTLPAPPVAFEWGFASAIIGDALYAFGGEPGPSTNASGYKFDFAANAWAPVAAIPENRGRGTLASAAVGDRLYVLNGNANDGSTILQIYDSATNSWSRGADLSGHAFEAAASAVSGTRIYFFGGADDQDIADTDVLLNATVSTSVNIYDTATNTWSTQLAMGAGKMWATAQRYNGEFHVLGGLDARSLEMISHEILRE